MARSRLVMLGALGAAAAGAYALVVRPWHLRWGAADSEVARELPRDRLLVSPKIRATHAITVNAPAERVWPWIVQIGAGRGGFYSYDFLENFMYRLNIHNADHILPEYQDVKAGEVIPFEPGGGGPMVAAIEPGRYLLLHGRMTAQSEGMFSLKGQGPEAYFEVTWLFYLDPVGARETRLIERFQLGWNPTLKNWLYYRVFLEPGSFIMERGMLMGIKRRAEKG